MTPAFLREFIRSLKAAGYTFVTPDAMLGPNRPVGNLAILSSDDGYHSIQRLLPILEEQAVPLTVFLTTEYSRRGAMHWWDQIYIAVCSQSRTRSRLKHDVRSRAERDEALRHMGIDPDATAFRDSHRLLSPEDVERLAGNPRLCFGNHTRNHLSLPLLENGVVQEEVEGARRDIQAWVGRAVHHFAFPYGDHDRRTLALLRRCGYLTAFTTEPGHFVLPPEADLTGTHVLPRYRLRADRSAKWQARIMIKGITVGARVQARLLRWIKQRLDKTHE
jgi:peptidoglycan/xylan/chitin deacetylase (PgdA/CDA1 family)